MSMIAILGGAAVVVVAVVAWMLTRSASLAGDAASEPVPATHASTDAPPAEPSRPVTSAAVALGKLTCEAQGNIYGALPPYGTLSLEDGVLVCRAESRIVAAAGNELASGDAASTIQSMGETQLGPSEYRVAVADVTAVTFSSGEGQTARLTTPAGEVRYTALGSGRAAELADWLGSTGLPV